MGRDEMRWDGMGWDEMRWDGIGWDEMRWDGMGWDENDNESEPTMKMEARVGVRLNERWL